MISSKKLFSFFTILLLIGCSTVPISDRKRLNFVGSLIPQDQYLQMASSQYRNILKEEKESTDSAKRAMVERVGSRIATAVDKYFSLKNLENPSKDFNWEFRLIESEQVNAFALPGGKIAVYTGILPITQNEDGLAVVIGHEIAHVIADHGAERISQQLLAQFGTIALAFTLEAKDIDNKELWVAAFGLGSQFGITLPFSRAHENEADYLGLLFMSLAGYDPAEAIPFWERMESSSGGTAPPEWLSTHPSGDTRIQNLKKWLPEAQLYYRK